MRHALFAITILFLVNNVASLPDSKELKRVKQSLVVLQQEVLLANDISNELKVETKIFSDFLTTVSTEIADDVKELLLKEARKSSKGTLQRYRFYVIMALGYYKDQDTYKFFDEILADKEPLMHIAVANAISLNPKETDIEYLFKIASGQSYPWEARYEASKTFEHFEEKLKENKELLLRVADLLKDESLRRRNRLEIVKRLKETTGFDIDSMDAATWKDKITENKEAPGTGIQSIKPTFFGIKLLSDRIFFVLDYSHSMKNFKHGFPKELPQPTEAEKKIMDQLNSHLNMIVTGQANSDPLCKDNVLKGKELEAFKKCKKIYDDWKGRTPGHRLDVLKIEIVKSIFFLDCETYFNIVLFHGYTDLWQQKLMQATWANKANALEFIVGHGTVLGTHTGEGMLVAFRFIEQRKYRDIEIGFTYKKDEHPFFLSNGVDTLVLFTDGWPWRDIIGGVKRGDLIVDFFARMKPSRKIQIDTIGFDDPDGGALKFLEDLARENYGDCKLLK